MSAVAGVTAIVNSVMAAYRTYTLLAAAAQWAWNAAQLANPTMWIVIGIIALIGVIALLIRYWGLVKAVFLAFWNLFKIAINACPDWLLAVVAPLLLIVKHFDMVKAAAEKTFGFIKKGAKAVGHFFGIGGGDDEDSSSTPSSHASGLSNVPYDGYVARLHKGERVLTATQAESSRGGAGAAGTVHIAKFADTLVIREEADVQKLAAAFVAELKMAGG
jgi:hypothetical protein